MWPFTKRSPTIVEYAAPAARARDTRQRVAEKAGPMTAAGTSADSTMTVDECGSNVWHNAQGQLHRPDGPAYEGADGDKEWHVNGQLHRTDGPAYEGADGKAWFVNGQLHRTDGPAVEKAHGTKEWYVNGKKMTEEQFNASPLVHAAREAQRQAALDEILRPVTSGTTRPLRRAPVIRVGARQERPGP